MLKTWILTVMTLGIVLVAGCGDRHGTGDERQKTPVLDDGLSRRPAPALTQAETSHGLLAPPRFDPSVENLTERRISITPRVTSVSQRGGRYYHSVALSPDRFAVASLRGVDYVDLTTMQNGLLQPYRQVDTTGDAWSVEIVGSTLWVADGYAGVTVLDRETGTWLARWPEREHARSFHTMQDGRVVVCRHRHGADLITPGNAGRSVTASFHIDAGERVFSATSHKNRLFLGTLGAGYQAFDVQGDTAVHRWTYENCTRIVWCGFARGHHYLLDQNNGLLILEDRGEKPPLLRGERNLPGQSRHAGFLDDRLLAIAHQHGLFLVDISIPEKPVTLSRVNETKEGRGITAAGDSIVFSESEFGIRILERKDRELHTVAVFEHNGLVADTVVIGDAVLIAQTGKGVAVTRSCRSDPVETYRWTDTLYPVSAAVRGSLIAVADTAGLLLLELEQDNTLVQTGRLNTPGRAVKVVFNGDHLFVADWFDGVHIIDYANPACPRIVSTIPVKGWAVDVAVRGGIAYICSVTEGLLVVDVNDPRNPRHLMTETSAQAPEAVTLAPAALYVADFNFGLMIYDLQNPEHPRAVASHRLDVTKNVTVRGDLLLVSNYIRGVRWFDISRPLRPVLIGEYDTPGKAYSAVFCGDTETILVADWHSLLEIEW